MSSKMLVENLQFVEALYASFLKDEKSVDTEWRAYFKSLGATDKAVVDGPHFTPRSIFSPRGGASNGIAHAAASPLPAAPVALVKHGAAADRVGQLVQGYRLRGHLYARLDPLGLNNPGRPDFDIRDFGLDQGDLEREFHAGGLNDKLKNIIALLEETYCRTIGVEVAHIEDRKIRQWLRKRMESTRNHIELSKAQQLQLLTKLTDAEIFESFIQTKFIGSKRFSLEGAESLIPLADLIVENAARAGVDEIVIGMAHRGRLNLLANVLGKPAREIFAEFEDKDPNMYLGRGDVKYHLGHSSDRLVDGRNIHLSLSFNPSHLEFVDAVVTGRVRAKQNQRNDIQRRTVLPLLIHGDAAFAGQGIVPELLNMSELKGYTVGGTIHVIVNNQVGFTTNPEDGRSTRYASDVAKMLNIPIFHVNGEDPEAVAQVVKLAVDFRLTFNRDVVIDLWCYRKLGHNEADEPSFTQPVMYQRIAEHPSVRAQFVKKLVEFGQLTQDQADEISVARRKILEVQLDEVRTGAYLRRPVSAMEGVWGKYKGGLDRDVPETKTGVPLAVLKKIGTSIVETPADFTPHPKLPKYLFEERREMAEGKRPLNWGMAEMLAYGSLVLEGSGVRLTGQDVERGTFTHRHAIYFDYKTGAPYSPLSHLSPNQANIEIRNSPLSELSCLGFEYGYSLDTPSKLVIWEAQFGDFVNGAQVIIDQFIVSGEDKWHRLSGLTLLLPHGFEGQGPEHSSGILERWLALCAEDNIQVCVPTTPAQMFHLLRRQIHRAYRKPLIVMTPKKLLRDDSAASSLEELTEGTFQRVLGDQHFSGPAAKDPAKVTRVLLCSGKVSYDLMKERKAKGREDVAIVRVEQLYPTPIAQIFNALKPFTAAKEVVWVQEEPLNRGAWTHMHFELEGARILPGPLHNVSRPTSASPATGSPSSHALEQRRIVEAAFAPLAPVGA